MCERDALSVGTLGARQCESVVSMVVRFSAFSLQYRDHEFSMIATYFDVLRFGAGTFNATFV